MGRLYYGRSARLYVAAVVYDEETGEPIPAADGDWKLVTRTKDLGTNEEATAMKATARDLEYAVSAQAEKDINVETECLLKHDETSDADKLLIRNAFDNNEELWVLLTKKPRNLPSGDGLILIGNVFGWPKKLPESGAETATLSFKQSSF